MDYRLLSNRWQASSNRRSAAVLTLASVGLSVLVGCGSFTSQGLNSEGVRLFDQTHYSEALREFHQALEHDPSNADSYYNLAATYHRLGVLGGQAADLAQAERYYDLCLDRDPDHRECYRGKAVLLVQKNRSEEAFRLLQGWADRKATSPEPMIELARLYEEFGDRNRAKQQLADALRVDSTNARALAAMGRLREQDGDPVQALANYQQSLLANQFQPDVTSRVIALQSSVGGGYAPVTSSDGVQSIARGSSSIR